MKYKVLTENNSFIFKSSKRFKNKKQLNEAVKNAFKSRYNNVPKRFIVEALDINQTKKGRIMQEFIDIVNDEIYNSNILDYFDDIEGMSEWDYIDDEDLNEIIHSIFLDSEPMGNFYFDQALKVAARYSPDEFADYLNKEVYGCMNEFRKTVDSILETSIEDTYYFDNSRARSASSDMGMSPHDGIYRRR